MKKILSLALMVFGFSLLTSCGGGGSSSSNSTNTSTDYSSFTPPPFPATTQTYSAMPNGFGSAIPDFAKTNNIHQVNIAWGESSNPAAYELVAGVNMKSNGHTYICSAAPIAGSSTGGTWLVGAAHCFVINKAQTNAVLANELLSSENISIFKGKNTQEINKIADNAKIYIPTNYCKGSSFVGLGACPNFTPEEGASGGEGNDIALIYIESTFGEVNNYPQITTLNNYPQSYSMAPVLSLGYGQNTYYNNAGLLFYVVNYYYLNLDTLGYHYLYNSYFDTNPVNLGYSALICGGDSGGPDLFWNGNSWILLSEHTYGPNGCGVNYEYTPNGSTNVAYYYDWITKIINNPSSCAESINNCVSN